MIIKIILTVVGLLLIAGTGVLIKVRMEQSKMRPMDTQEIISGVYALKNKYVNFYLIKSGERYIAIDAGLSDSKTIEELKSLDISSNDVAAVFLTHAHSDHIGALSVFGNAVVYIGKSETTNSLKNPRTTLLDDESVDISGISIRCIYTPGHTNGSTCYLINGKYLFVGDTLSLHGNQVGLFNSFYNKSNEIQKASIQRLAELRGVECVFSSHYGFTNNAVFSS